MRRLYYTGCQYMLWYRNCSKKSNPEIRPSLACIRRWHRPQSLHACTYYYTTYHWLLSFRILAEARRHDRESMRPHIYSRARLSSDRGQFILYPRGNEPGDICFNETRNYRTRRALSDIMRNTILCTSRAHTHSFNIQ